MGVVWVDGWMGVVWVDGWMGIVWVDGWVGVAWVDEWKGVVWVDGWVEGLVSRMNEHSSFDENRDKGRFRNLIPNEKRGNPSKS